MGERFFPVAEVRPLRRQKPAILEQEGKVVLRPLRESDIPSIVTIDEWTSGRSKPQYWRNKLSRYLLQGSASPDAEECVLARVAEMNGDVVGFVIGEIRRWEFT